MATVVGGVMYTEEDTKPFIWVLLIGGVECGKRHKVYVDVTCCGEFVPCVDTIQVVPYSRVLLPPLTRGEDKISAEPYTIYSYTLGSVWMHYAGGHDYYYALSTLTQNEKKALLVKYFNFIK
jgi:hypothetical protein